MPINTPDAFRGIDRLYGDHAYQTLSKKRIYVVGIGGVGSWVVESLARSAQHDAADVQFAVGEQQEPGEHHFATAKMCQCG